MGDSREWSALRSAQIAPNKDAAHPFDIEYGTDTGGYLSPKEIVTGARARCVGVRIFGDCAVRVSGHVPALAATLADPAGVSAYSFVDIGAGKGERCCWRRRFPFVKWWAWN